MMGNDDEIYCIAGKFGHRELNFAVWQSAFANAKLKPT